MHRLNSLTLMVAATLLVSSACAQGTTATATNVAGQDVVARFNDKVITNDEFAKILGHSTLQLENQLYQQKVQALTQDIFKRLVEAAAAKEGVTTDEYHKAHVASKITPPPEEEIASVMQQYRPRLPQDDAQAREQVLGFLNQQRNMRAMEDLRLQLFKEANVQITLEPPRAEVPVRATNPTRGPQDAPVTLVEYTDFECPYCGRAQQTVSELLKRYDGKLRHVFKQLPLDMHQNARGAAEASLCAMDQGKFWELHDWMFANRASIAREGIEKQAETLGFDMTKFRECLDQKVHAADVNADANEAREMGIGGTPAFLVNGRLVSGAMPTEAFVDLINDELRRKGVEVPAAPAPEAPKAQS